MRADPAVNPAHGPGGGPPACRPGEHINLRAGPWDTEGCTHNDVGGIEVRTWDAIPGEAMEVVVLHRSKGGPVAWARPVALRPAAPHRQDPPCSVHDRCGGCGLQHVTAEAQLHHKVAGALALSGLPEPLRRVLAPPQRWLHSPSPWGHRHKAVFLPVRRGRRLRLGAWARGSNSVVGLDACPVLAPNLSDARERLERSLSTPIVRDGRPLQLPGMPDRPQRGGALRAILGRANRKGEVLLTMIVTDPSTAEWLRPVARGMVDGPGGVVGVSLAVRAGPGDALLEGGPVLSLAGRPGLIEEVDGVSIPVLPDSFFQVQPDVAESMTRTAGAWIGQQPGGPILDVYCGTGLFGLTLARHTAGPIVGVDHDAQAVAAAAEAAAHQGLPAEFVAGAPAVVLDAALRGRSIAAAILDPPRSGCRPSDLVAVLERRPRTIVAVSCHAPSLARDAQRILEAGYVAGELLPADMMPQTPHLEWMACFRLDAEGPPRP